MYVVTSEQMRALDRHTIDKFGIPPVALMENAGKAIAEEVLRLCLENRPNQASAAFDSHGIRGDATLLLEHAEDEHWLILAGKGSNGGDGAVAARHLREAGVRVTLLYADEPSSLTGEAAIQRDAAAAIGIPLRIHGQGEAVDYRAYTGIVDALLGTGASGAPRGSYAAMIQAANESGLPIVSADIPSGLDADTGMLHEPCIRSAMTVCLAFLKRGLTQYPGVEAAGRVVVRSIGIPSSLCKEHGVEVFLLTPEVLRAELGIIPDRPRSPEGHKGTYGHVLTVGGSLTMSGAGLLASRAALRAGAGLVTWALPDGLLLPLTGAAPELMLTPGTEAGSVRWNEASAVRILELLSSRDVLAVGPGLGRFEGDGRWLRRLWEESQTPMVIDADALNILSSDTDFSRWKSSVADVVLTPHPGEMSRLTGLPTAEVQKDRIGIALKYAVDHQVTLVLKGARSVIATPDGKAYINLTGHAGMATGGTGDVLTGMISGLLAQGLSGPQAAVLGVRQHGLAGERAASNRVHPSAVIAGDLIESL